MGVQEARRRLRLVVGRKPFPVSCTVTHVTSDSWLYTACSLSGLVMAKVVFKKSIENTYLYLFTVFSEYTSVHSIINYSAESLAITSCCVLC